MTLSLKHSKPNVAADTSDTTLIQPSDWNAGHDLSLTGPALIGRAAAGAGAAQEITLDPSLSLSAGGVLSVPAGSAVTAIADAAQKSLLLLNEATGARERMTAAAFVAAMGQAVTGLNTTTLASGLLVTVTDPATGTEYKTTLSALSTFFGATGGTVSTPPGAPTGLTLGTATSSTQPLSWTTPSSAGTSAITDYTVQYAIAGSGSWQTFAHTASTATSITVTGLTAGTSYDYRVAAVSAAGSSSYSSTATGSTAAASGTPAGAPTALTLGTATSTTQPLSWTAGTAGSTATTDYIVQYRVTGSGSWSTFSDGVSTATSATVTGLTPGVSHDYQVAAVNSAGNSSFSSTATGSTAADVPGQVTGLTRGTATSATQPLSWTAPAANGSAIIDYVIQYRVTGSGSWTTFADGTSTTTSATVTGLTAGTSYDYQVAAVNAVGTGASSSTVTGSTAAASATAYTLTGPTSGTAGSPSSAFTVTASGVLAAGVTVTPSDGGAGGTFTPSTVTLAAGTNTSATFTYTSASGGGAVTISATNNGGLTNPASITYTAAANLLTAKLRTSPTTTTAYNGSSYAGFSGLDTFVYYNGVAKATGTVKFMFGTSPTVPPTKTSTGLPVTYQSTSPVNNTNDLMTASASSNQATYPGMWLGSWPPVWGGPTGPDYYYLWVFTDDNGGSACAVKDSAGTAPVMFTVNT